MMKHISYISLLSISVLVLGSCTDKLEEAFGYGYGDPSETIMFKATTEDAKQPVIPRSVGGYTIAEQSDWVDTSLVMHDVVSRAAPYTSMPQYVSVYAFQWNNAISPASWTGTTIPDENKVLMNEKFEYSDGKLTQVSGIKYWSEIDSTYTMFCAFAPYDASVAPTISGGYPGVDYTPSTDVTKQTDILYALTMSPTKKEVIPMEFKHALTAIQFKMGFGTGVVMKSISIQKVNTHGFFALSSAESGKTWDTSDTPGTYTISFGSGKTVSKGDTLTAGENTLMVIPQTFASGSTAKVVFTYIEGGETKTKEASLASSSWLMGKKILYTLYDTPQSMEMIFMDLAAGIADITNSTYSGYVFVNNGADKLNVTGEYNKDNKFYIYQSTEYNRSTTGYPTATTSTTMEQLAAMTPVIPTYPEMTYNGKTWSDYITNNNDVNAVINAWNNNAETVTGRTSCPYYLRIATGASTAEMLYFDVTIDNLWSSLYAYTINKTSSASKMNATIGGTNPFMISRRNNHNVTIKIKGDNRFNNIYHYSGEGIVGRTVFTSYTGDKSTSGTLTIASFTPDYFAYDCMPVLGYGGGNASTSGYCYGLEFAGGTIFGGVPPQLNDVWQERYEVGRNHTVCIGGSANNGADIFITGGRLTAVSHGTSTAIGGGGGYNGANGYGNVYISGGETYAYAYGVYSTYTADGRQGFVGNTAIGGPSTFGMSQTNPSIVEISGGKVYAESLGGVAIGGGSCRLGTGSGATIKISGTARVTAISKSGYVCTSKDGSTTMYVSAGNAIGGGSSTADGANLAKSIGGDATVEISGGELKAGSVGGGSGNSKLGCATIAVTGGTTSAQFIMAAGSSTAPSFKIEGGTINASKTSDTTYEKVKKDGGAVYMEAGTCTVSGGAISNCTGETGGAIYMKGGTFTMTGGTISGNRATGTTTAAGHGGAVAVDGGSATISGGTITKNVTTNGNGGGVYVSGGNFTNSGGTITGNSANTTTSDKTNGNGGGVYVGANTTEDKTMTATISSGSVKGNSADTNGGGLCINMEGKAKATITIGSNDGTKTSPDMSGNSAGFTGGALCVLGSNSNVSVNSGNVTGHTVAYQPNPSVRNDGGLVTLNNIDKVSIPYNTITFNARNGSNTTSKLYVVTNTNSKLVVPAEAKAWEYTGYTFQGWNTSKYGTGTTYTDGQTVKITSDLQLYAIWKANE